MKKTKNLMKNFNHLLMVLVYTTLVNRMEAQISGSVFRDYNGNGTMETSAPNEPLAAGIIVTAYGANDAIVASYTTTNASAPNYTIPVSGTTFNGTLGSNTGFVANATVVRLEFVIPNSGTCSVNGTIDYPSAAGVTYGTATRFLPTSGSARINNNFAFNYPGDLVSSTYNPLLFIPRFSQGNPTGGGTTGTSDGLNGFSYNNSGVTVPAAKLTTANVGCVYGMAYSRPANKLFAGAYIRRYYGLGPAFSGSSGAIYLINNLGSATPTASAFYDMDGNGYATRYNGLLAYGSTTSFSITGTAPLNTINYLGATDPNSGLPIGLGVVGANSGSATTTRNLSASNTVASNDPAAWGQVGRVGLGDIEISDDGKYLFVVNLYDRKLYRLTLNDPINPTAVTAVSSYALPAPPARSSKGGGFIVTYGTATTAFYTGAAGGGYQRPFGLKYYRGKVYVATVTSGETGGTSTKDNNSGVPEYTDLWAYVWQFDADAGTPAFNTTPLLQEPQNYNRGTNGDAADETWHPWTNTFQGAIPADASFYYYSQPMFTGIEFDNDGSMVLSFRDRFGDQMGSLNKPLTGNGSYSAGATGEILRAYKNNATCTYELEVNAKEGASSSKLATAGVGDNQGPGGGEFYYQDNTYNVVTGSYTWGGGTNFSNTWHLNLSEGSLVMLPGATEITSTFVDPFNLYSGGVSWYNNTTGANARDYQLHIGNTVQDLGKTNGLGDMEMVTPLAPIEIGNRVWNDLNGDGIQNAGEPGIANVSLELVDNLGNPVDSDPLTIGIQQTFVTTDANGNWFLTSATGTDAAGINYGVAFLPNTIYKVKLATGVTDDWDPAANGGLGAPRAGQQLTGMQLTQTNITGNGQPDFSDNDASLISSIPQITITIGNYGENNHNIDFGFALLLLPSKIISFTAVKQNSQSQLQFTIAQAATGSVFTIERSTNGTSFLAIGSVNGSPASTYHYTDAVPVQNAKNFYRIKELDAWGKVSYSEIRMVKFTKSTSMEVYPIPATSNINILFNDDLLNQPVTITLYNMLGKEMVRRFVNQAGSTETLNISTYAIGVYQLRILHNNSVVSERKIVIIK
jgi:hypothetical protein